MNSMFLHLRAFATAIMLYVIVVVIVLFSIILDMPENVGYSNASPQPVLKVLVSGQLDSKRVCRLTSWPKMLIAKGDDIEKCGSLGILMDV